MRDFAAEPAPPRRARAIRVWLMLAILVLGPSLLVWLVRGTGFAFGCRPGPDSCAGLPLGIGLRGALDLAWYVAFNGTLVVLAGIAAAVAALFARRPLLAFLSALAFPPASLLLPVLAVVSASYQGCAANEGGIGNCTVWGSAMGMSFHNAAMAPWQLYIVEPYSVAAAVMLGLVGLVFCRRAQ